MVVKAPRVIMKTPVVKVWRIQFDRCVTRLCDLESNKNDTVGIFDLFGDPIQSNPTGMGVGFSMDFKRVFLGIELSHFNYNLSLLVVKFLLFLPVHVGFKRNYVNCLCILWCFCYFLSSILFAHQL